MINSQLIHANTAAVGQLHPEAAAAMKDALQRLPESNFYDGIYKSTADIPERFRDAVGRLIAGHRGSNISHQVAITTSTSDAIAKFIDIFSEHLTPGSAVAICQHSFASIHLALRRLQLNDVRVIQVGNASGTLSPTDLVSVPNLKACVVEWVNHKTGAKNCLQSILEYCTTMGVEVLVDAVQGLGAAPVDFDFRLVGGLACGAHKWLRGSEGTGFLFVNDRILNHSTPRQLGYRSIRDPRLFDNPQDWVLSQDARVLEVGTLNTLGLLGAVAAIESLLEHGAARTCLAIQRNTGSLLAELQSFSQVQLVTPLSPERHAGIVSFKHKECPAAKVVENLKKAHVVAGSRGNLVRLSPAADADIGDLCQRVNWALAMIQRNVPLHA